MSAPAGPVAVAVLAKAPLPGYAKTRLAPVLGAHGAARLQAALVERTLATAVAAAICPVTLWCAPDAADPFLAAAARRHGVAARSQEGFDLGARMLAALAASPVGCPTVVIGTDCPCLTPDDLREAARLLRDGEDAVMAPAEDGGYGLVGACRPLPSLFDGMPWSTSRVAALTRARAVAAGLRLADLRTVWDVDTPADLERLRREGLLDGVGEG